MTTTMNPLAEDYLRRLDHTAHALPRREREDLVAEIRAHLAAALQPGAGEAEVRNVLDDLGAPEDIVAAARPERPPTRRGALEVIALVLLVSGFPPVLGWLVGVVLLLLSPAWTGRQKLLAILVWPGGYTAVLSALGVVPMIAPAGSPGSCVTEGTVTQGTTDGTVTTCTDPGGLPLWGFIVLGLVALAILVAPLLVVGYLYRAAGRQVERGSS